MLMITAFISQIATQLLAAIFQARVTVQSTNLSYDKNFFFGSMGAFATLWLFTDVLSKGKNLYTLLAVVIISQAMLVLCQIITTAAKQSNLLIISEEASVLMFAYLQCVTVVLQL